MVHMDSVTLVIQVGGLIDILLTLKEGSAVLKKRNSARRGSCGVDALA